MSNCSEATCEVFELCKWRVGLEKCETFSMFTSGSMYVQLPHSAVSGEVQKDGEEVKSKYCLRFKKEKQYYSQKKGRMLRPI
jgi:hypothetical protein